VSFPIVTADHGTSDPRCCVLFADAGPLSRSSCFHSSPGPGGRIVFVSPLWVSAKFDAPRGLFRLPVVDGSLISRSFPFWILSACSPCPVLSYDSDVVSRYPGILSFPPPSCFFFISALLMTRITSGRPEKCHNGTWAHLLFAPSIFSALRQSG